MWRTKATLWWEGSIGGDGSSPLVVGTSSASTRRRVTRCVATSLATLALRDGRLRPSSPRVSCECVDGVGDRPSATHSPRPTSQEETSSHARGLAAVVGISRHCACDCMGSAKPLAVSQRLMAFRWAARSLAHATHSDAAGPLISVQRPQIQACSY